MQDSLRAVLDTVFAGAAYDWEPRPDPFAFIRRAWLAFLSWLGDLRDAWPTAFDAAFWVAVVGVVLLVARAAWITTRSFRVAAEEQRAGRATPVKDARWYRLEAERLAAAGRIVEAMQADFTALILDLDARRVLRFHPAKTPQEYVREAALPEPVRGELASVVWSLYRHAFAREPLPDGAWESWRARTAPEKYAPAH